MSTTKGAAPRLVKLRRSVCDHNRYCLLPRGNVTVGRNTSAMPQRWWRAGKSVFRATMVALRWAGPTSTPPSRVSGPSATMKTQNTYLQALIRAEQGKRKRTIVKVLSTTDSMYTVFICLLWSPKGDKHGGKEVGLK